MPVYVRRRQATTPETLNEFSTDEEDFVADPDQCRDILPQPYRLVAKLLDAAIDEIWEQIAEREGERLEEQQRQLPPQFSSGGSVENLQRVKCLCTSPDHAFVFVGQADGLSVLRVGQHSAGPVDTWHSTEFDIVSLNCSVISEGTYLLAANDDMGLARLFAFAGERLLLLKIMNDSEGDKKVLATKVDLAAASDFCGLALENPASGEVWVEIHKLPKDAWVKELDSVSNSRRQAAAKRAAAQEEAAGDEGATQRSATASPVEEDRTSHKFSAPTLVLRCRPTPKISGITASTVSAALKPVDGTGDVLGIGTVHPLTTGHLESRQTVFESLHEGQLQHLPTEGESQREFQSPNWHFLNNGRSLPVGLEQPHNENGALLTGGLALWWQNGRQLLIFSLLRPAKEVEHRHDQLFPFTSPISASCLSPCSTLLAVGLATGHVALVDWHLGLTRRLVLIDAQSVLRLRFLGPIPGPSPTSTADGYPPYKDRSQWHLMVVMADASIFTLPVTSERVAPARVGTSDKHQHERPAWVDTVPAGLSLVVRVSHAGLLTLHNVLGGEEICRLALPDEAAVAEPWQPQLCLPQGSDVLFVRGHRAPPPPTADTPENGEPEEAESVLLAVDISQIQQLQRHLRGEQTSSSSPAVPHISWTERANALLELRLKTHADRTAKLQERWQRLQQTFRTLQERKAGLVDAPLDE